MVSELFGHLSFVLLAFSYTLSDLLPLRVLAVSSSTAMTFFAYFHPHGRILYLPFRWNCLFIVINVAQIVKILAEDMRAYMLDEGSKQLWRDHLQAMDLIDFAKLLTICSQVTYKKNEVMFEQGEKNDYMFLVIEGEIACQVDGVQTYSLNGGNFVAEAALHAGALIKDAVAVSATAVALEPTTVLKMHRRELIELLEKNPSLKKSLQNALTWDIVSKLKRQRHALVASDMVSERTRNWTEKRNKMTEERYASKYKIRYRRTNTWTSETHE